MTATPDLAPLDSARIRTGVTALRAAMSDGSLHHHDGDARQSPTLDVVRLWAAGRALEVQRRHCRDCPDEPLAPRPRARS